MFASYRWLWTNPRCSLAPRFAVAEAPVWLYLLLLFYTVSLYAALGERLSILSAIRHELVLAVVMLGLCAMFMMANPPRLRGEGRLITAAGIYVLVLLYQIPMAVVPSVAQQTFMDSVFKHIVFAFFVIVIVRSPRHMIGLYGAWLFSLFWLYQEAVRGLISGSLMWYNQGIRRLHGSVELYRHPNGLSLIACTCLPFLFHLVPVFRRMRVFLLWLLATGGLAALCILYTGSRAGYVGVLGMLPFWALTRPNRGRNLMIMAGMLLVIVLVMPEQYKGRFESIGAEEEAAGHSREARLQIMEDAWAVFKLHPLGTGIDGFQIVRAQMFGKVQDTHNLYLQILTHLGIQGMVAWLFLIVSMFQSLNGTIRRLDAILREVRDAANRVADDRAARRQLGIYFGQMRILRAAAMGTRMFLFFMLVNGLFAHTLYLVSWWFVLAQACVLGEMSRQLLDHARRRAAQETITTASLVAT
ncbi:MAG TPA: O-antigen ligase family protein [Candidatus Krumholzibacteria bacterium]|nr:O-antigen ligase family protein [Candidatus Krumholzibacteria bacterium]HPD72022.1 O-antigen ligase family protein [Candidatus Krumholzibacteria bacterium]HRY41045.1 O-antigen ligase family protein [Candidatus Krumholzibacteria bacterium]